jgi:transcription antitermination factor NusA-like protein
MQTPIPEEEIRAGELSAGTKKKLAEGMITPLDVEVAQILYKINERYNISNASFYRALDLGRTVLILTKGEAGVLIGKQGKTVSELSSAIGRKVRIAEVRGDMRKTVSDIIMPAQLLGINKVFHEGREVTKVRIGKRELAQLPLDLASLEKALRSLLESEVQIVFE